MEIVIKEKKGKSTSFVYLRAGAIFVHGDNYLEEKEVYIRTDSDSLTSVNLQTGRITFTNRDDPVTEMAPVKVKVHNTVIFEPMRLVRRP